MKTVASFMAVGMIVLATLSRAMAEFAVGLVNVDLTFAEQTVHQSGQAVIGTPGDVWNGITSVGPITSGILRLATGAPSGGVKVSLSGSITGSAEIGPFASTPYAPMMGDWYATLPGNTMTINFDGLTPLQPYELYLYSYSFRNATTSSFTIGNTSLFAANDGSSGVFIEGNNFVHFLAQPADVTGHIAILVQGSSGPASPFGIVNGLQIAAVPEPSALMIVAGAALCLIPLALQKQSANTVVGACPRR